MSERTRSELTQLQGMPLFVKIKKTQQRIREWLDEFGDDGVYISFSGGKDSTVLLDIVRKMFPDVEAVFCDTGLEYPEIRDFVKSFDNVVWLKPKKPMAQIIREYGYPIISKEVAEAVEGARKYLTCVINATESDRPDQTRPDQTRPDQTRPDQTISLRTILQENMRNRRIFKYQFEAEKLLGIGRYKSYNLSEQSRAEQSRADRWSALDSSTGGLDNKWRKVRGIVEYANRQQKSSAIDRGIFK